MLAMRFFSIMDRLKCLSNKLNSCETKVNKLSYASNVLEKDESLLLDINNNVLYCENHIYESIGDLYPIVDILSSQLEYIIKLTEEAKCQKLKNT